MPKLKVLKLNNNKIEKIENLGQLPQLNQLNLDNNKISKIENIERLHRLEFLNLGDNAIQKIENLDALIGLYSLSLNDNKISKIEGLENLDLTHLYLKKNPITKEKCEEFRRKYFKNSTKSKTLECGNWNFYFVKKKVG